MRSFLRFLILMTCLCAIPKATAQNDVADIPSQKLQAANDPNKTYFLIGPAKNDKLPAGGYKLLLVLPGGDGSASFLPFVKRIYKHAAPDGYLLAQLVAPRWTPHQQIVWPHSKNKVPEMKFTTEQFIEAVVADLHKRHKINPKYVFTLSWSSSGPAAYATSLQQKTAVTGSYIAMSVFNEKYLPPLSRAKGRTYYIEHSPDDKVCPFWMARRAGQQLTKAGAKVNLATYKGGHGWRGNVYGRICNAIVWLQENTKRDIEQSVEADG